MFTVTNSLQDPIHTHTQHTRTHNYIAARGWCSNYMGLCTVKTVIATVLVLKTPLNSCYLHLHKFALVRMCVNSTLNTEDVQGKSLP